MKLCGNMPMKCTFDGKNFRNILCKTAVDEALVFTEIKHESYYNTIYQWNSKECTVKMHHEDGFQDYSQWTHVDDIN